MQRIVLVCALAVVPLVAAVPPPAASHDAAAPITTSPVRAPVDLGTDSVPWQSRATCPATTERPAWCTAGDYVYVLGGHDASSVTRASVYRYHPGTDAWDSVAPMLQATDNMGACYSPAYDKIFLFCGYNPEHNKTQIYDVAAGTWSYGADAPHADFGTAAAAVGDYVYVQFGYYYPGEFWRYDPAGDSWTQLASCPGATSHGALCVMGGQIYASGGWDANTMFNRYDPGTNIWTPLAAMPVGRQGHGMDAFNGRVYVYGGGQGWFPPIQNCYSWDPALDAWTPEGDMLYAHIAGGFGGLLHAGEFLLHATGGYNGSLITDLTEQGAIPAGGVSPDSLYFKGYAATYLTVSPKTADPNPVNRTAMSFMQNQSLPCMDPRGMYVYEVDGGMLRTFSTDDGSYTDHALGMTTGWHCGTDGNFLYAPVPGGNQVHKFTMDGVYINTTVVDTTIDTHSFGVANDTVWVSPDRYGEMFCGYGCDKFNGGSITRDVTWAVGPGINGTGNIAWDDEYYYINWIGTSNITFKIFDHDRALADSGLVSIATRSVLARWTPPMPWHDVAVTRIMAPTGTVDSGTVVVPACSVYSYSARPIASYGVRMRIGAYNQVAPVANHLPGTARYVTFPGWTAMPVGVVPVTCSTQVASDGCPANDAARDSVIVLRVVGCEEPGPGPAAWTAFCDITPNPAPAVATVSFGLPRPGPYSLALYDVTGRQAALLCEGAARPLMTPVPVSRERLGLAAGVYLLVLEGTDFRTTRKLLLE